MKIRCVGITSWSNYVCVFFIVSNSLSQQKSQLKSDCKKEIQDIITQIRDKYARKLQDAEAAYCLRKNELDNNYNKVFMHKILAEAFKSKCINLWPSQHPGTQEGT